MNPKFKPTTDGLEIVDLIERFRYHLTTHEPVSVDSVPRKRIPYPIDEVVELNVSTQTVPGNSSLIIRDATKTLLTELTPDEQRTLPDDEYIFEISSQLKL